METFLQDLRHSLRLLAQARAFTLAAVLALALGIGLNTAIFSVVNAVLLKPTPFPQSDRLVFFTTASPDGTDNSASPAKFAYWCQQSAAIEDAAAFSDGVLNWTGQAFPEQLRSAQVSVDYFRLFGAQVLRGRTFTAEEDQPKGPHVAVIRESLWRRRFSSQDATLGQSIELGNEPHLIVGIIADSFDATDIGDQPEVWVPFQLNLQSGDQGHYFSAAARLKPGVSVAQANAALAASTPAYKATYPDAIDANNSFGVESLAESLVSNVRPTLLVLLAAVGLVLLIACANVANLLLARAIARRRELAIRAALGAARGRLIRQLLTESLLLSSAGAALGLLLGTYGMRALLLVNTAGLPRVGENGALVNLDARVLLFTVGLALFTALLFGLLPAFQISRVDLTATLKEGGSRSGSGFHQNKSRMILVVSEIAIAVVLVIGAALLIRTSLALQSVEPGFTTKNVLTMRMSLAGKQYNTAAAIERLARSGRERLLALPGVLAATATCCIPLEGGYGLPFFIVGRPTEKSPFHGGGRWLTIAPGYFDTFQIPVVKGRVFDDRDSGTAQQVVVINETMAKRFWPGKDPLQDRLLIGKGVMPALSTEQPRQIIGVVRDVRDGGLNQDPRPTMYVPNGQVPDALQALNVSISPLRWAIRTQGDPGPLIAPMQEQLRQASGLPVSDVRTMSQVVSRSTARDRFRMALMSIFGFVALLLAAIGVYGLMAYSVQQRTQEIGIRMALGAPIGAVRSMVLSQGMRLALAGVVIGTASAWALARFLESFLFGVKPNDPLVFILTPVVLAATAFLAVLFPALRATRIDPLEALRHE